MTLAQPVIAVFDIGKTNKKVFLFNEAYTIVYEKQVTIPEITDDDGEPCDDIQAISSFVTNSLQELLLLPQYHIKAVNATAYGASWVHVNKEGTILSPLYSYLKTYPPKLAQQFLTTYAGESQDLFRHTASPLLYSLNSGLQLYRLKYEKPHLYQQIQYSLHLPQFITSLISKVFYSEYTSIGCHTLLWNFTTCHYHDWVNREQLTEKFPPLQKSNEAFDVNKGKHLFKCGAGLHDSSAALVPYLLFFKKPFILLSTGTWNIAFNAFTAQPITKDELAEDNLQFLSYAANPVKAARAFLGYDHDTQTRRIADTFQCTTTSILKWAQSCTPEEYRSYTPQVAITPAFEIGKPYISAFEQRNLSSFRNGKEAYLQLIIDIAEAQFISLRHLLNVGNIQNIFVDGGFAKNILFMHFLSLKLKRYNVWAADMPQATAMGAALAIHEHWNDTPLKDGLIQVTRYNAALP